MSGILLTMDNLAMRQFAVEKASPPDSAGEGTVSSVGNNLDPTSDEALLVKVSNSKSKEAFGQLFDRFANKVLRME